ncbi:assimilatory sulfite reductase (NADPH) flavoprotein subunit [Hymenobacter sp. 15J16-1T3B]|uniref:assimilatory sulfite reductase (NADPH) flavoprotein subunit n=1 Tax=Hymenobacter sp. 15J16-1T3B TaxID=2886941 RepID=UPI001D1272FE|nr:assimilatory sulfite reductase (NADPH) flavoprotein subunit [Hymenobacter sp. 15J16-1T3B]MCC3155686.1 assimilatory sulfite reductase (NADPH) flavoprotein subunit [Hymenobacter sp. 15J16-1T3B]
MSTSDTGQRLPIAFDDHVLRQLAGDFSEQQLLWLSGYFYGRYAAGSGSDLAAAVAQVAPAQTTPAAAGRRLTVLYGSQTGNSKKVALQAVEAAQQRGLNATARDMNDYQGRELSKEEVLLVVVSTQGEGEPPVAAEELHRFLGSARAPKLPQLRYAVLALGDRSYLQFCQTGRDFDERLGKLGATALAPRVDCDLDFHADARQWIAAVLDVLGQPATSAAVSIKRAPAPLTTEAYSRHHPLTAEVLEKIQLNGRGSTKETYHLELSLAGSGLQYEPGDALSVIPTNSEALVEEVLRATQLSADAPVLLKGERLRLATALTERLELSTLSRDVLERYAQHQPQPKLRELAGATQQLQAYLYGRDAADLLVDYPAELSAQQLVDTLRPLPARAYSLASSLLAHPDEAHLTVGAVRYDAHGRRKQGTCSCYLADRVQVGDSLRVFVERNEYFKLPQDPSANIIMVGAGTGVAPFRGFVEERAERGASGLNWLVFGNPHFTTDFLYQTEWQQHFKRGTLAKLHVAFSRDQTDKIYVHNRLLEYARDVYDWLESGAYLYVCGDKQRLAATVHKALVSVVQLESGASLEEAEAYVRALKKQRRYLEDVY